MQIVTPDTITSVAWEGELVPPPALTYGVTRGVGDSTQRPVASIGRHEVWPVAVALENEVGKKWVPPLGDASFWLVRLACTLHQPGGWAQITEAQQLLRLRPHNPQAQEDATYAYSLFPDRLGVESNVEFSVGLGPELNFAPAVELKLGELGAKIEYKKVFPVIQSYGAGEPTPYWIFKPHAARPLAGSQFVYAVVAARAGAGGIWARVDLLVTVETRFGPLRFGMPEEASAYTQFTLP